MLDTYLDRSSSQRVEPSKASILLRSYTRNMNVLDVWQISSDTGREYSFHSRALEHNIYARFNFYLVDGRLLPLSYSAKYNIISDQGLISFSLHLGKNEPAQRSWRFNPQLFTDTKFWDYLESNVKLFFKTFDKEDISLLWEALKIYLRGHIISFQSSLKRRDKAK